MVAERCEAVVVTGQFSLAFGAAPQAAPLYFALRPPAVAARAMMEIASRYHRDYGFSEPLYGSHRLHLSLSAAMSARGPRKDDLQAALRAAARIQAMPFPVSFGRLCTFQVRRDKRPTVLCCSDGLEKLAALRDRLRRALVREGLGRGRADFEPHLTLVWDWKSIPPSSLDEPIGWTVEDFVLLQTAFGKRRQVERGRWPLRA